MLGAGWCARGMRDRDAPGYNSDEEEIDGTPNYTDRRDFERAGGAERDKALLLTTSALARAGGTGADPRKEAHMCAATREEKLFDEACDALRKMHYNLAFDLFSEVMEIVPENPEVHYNRGLAAGHLLKWQEAEENFNMSLRLRQDPDCLMHRALARLHLRHWDDALVDLDSVLSMEKENELAKMHRRDLVMFLQRSGRSSADVPFFCSGWFDERLDEFIGVDPEIVPKADRADLREYIAQALAPEGAAGCDHTFRITEEWAVENHRDPPGVCRFLFERGMRCDCDVLREEEKVRNGEAR